MAAVRADPCSRKSQVDSKSPLHKLHRTLCFARFRQTIYQRCNLCRRQPLSTGPLIYHIFQQDNPCILPPSYNRHRGRSQPGSLHKYCTFRNFRHFRLLHQLEFLTSGSNKSFLFRIVRFHTHPAHARSIFRLSLRTTCLSSRLRVDHPGGN